MLMLPSTFRPRRRRSPSTAAFAPPLATRAMLQSSTTVLTRPARSLCPARGARAARPRRRGVTQAPRCAGAVYEDDDGRRLVPVALFVSATEGAAVSGVYAVESVDGEVEFISLSRDVRASLLRLADEGVADEAALAAVRVLTFRTPVPNLMAQVAHDWIADCDELPRGNALGWPEHDADLAARADWPPVYAARGTYHDDGRAGAPRVSPFAPGRAGADAPGTDAAVAAATAAAAEAAGEAALPLSVENVDAALEEVRPFLLADGGNIRVVRADAESGAVEVVLEGACGGCASAGTTMREGVEKVLRARFGAALQSVTAVQEGGGAGGLDPGLADIVSKSACERALEPIQAVLRGLGAHVRVLEVDEDEVVVSFSGPNNLRLGVETQLLERVSGLEVVTFEKPS